MSVIRTGLKKKKNTQKNEHPRLEDLSELCSKEGRGSWSQKGLSSTFKKRKRTAARKGGGTKICWGRNVSKVKGDLLACGV